MTQVIDLTNRLAKCGDVCLADKAPIQSRLDLPYFRYQPDQDFDYYYCGCVGWD